MIAAAEQNLLSIILGGGAGSPLFPLTHERSTPAVHLGDKYRLVDIPVSNCINSGMTKILILTQYNSASLNRHVARTYQLSPFSQGFVEILAAEQTPENPHWFQGTADAVRQILPHIADQDFDTLLILSADHLYRMDYRDLLRHHFKTGADVTISVTPCSREAAAGFGLLKTDAGGRITEFREKPQGDALDEMRVDTRAFGLSAEQADERQFLASMGIYVFNYEWLEKLLREKAASVDFAREVIPAALECCNVQAFLFNGYWEDIGTVAAFYRANMDMTSPLPKFNFFDADAPVFTRARYLPPSRVQSCEIFGSIISEGCLLQEATLIRSIIGLRSRIERGARVEESLLMGADYYQTSEQMRAEAAAGVPRLGIGEGTVIRRAIIDKNARIGAGVRLLNEAGLEHADGEGGSYYIRDGIIIVPKNVTIRDGTVICHFHNIVWQGLSR